MVCLMGPLVCLVQQGFGRRIPGAAEGLPRRLQKHHAEA